MFSLISQRALVTGASRGIGHAMAMALAKQGAWVAGTATTLAGAEAFSRQLAELALQGQGFVLDVCDTTSINHLVTSLKHLSKPPTILVNNAGIARDSLALRLTERDWQAVINTNLKGAFQLSQQCLMPMLKARYGRIINIGSVVGLTGNPGQTHYAAAKAALIGFSKSLAWEVASRGVTVNVIAPGFIETDMTTRLSQTQRESLLQKMPIQHLGQVEDIAHAGVFLASQEAGYITGHTLHVNGGLFMA